MSTMLGRRSFLRLAVTGVAGRDGGRAVERMRRGVAERTSVRLGAVPKAARDARGRILLAYFSRAGENYYYGGRRNLEVGNTEVLAGMICASLACDVHRIEAVDRYPANYEQTVERNVREQDADARPAIANPLPLDRPVRHGVAGQPRLERQSTDDHADVCRALRLLRQDRPSVHHARHERSWDDPRRLQAGL